MNKTKTTSVHPVDAFKDISELHVPDIRVTYWTGGVDRNLNLFYENIKSIVLDECVPVEIKVQFETAKNVLLYSFFAYRMSTVAKSYAYSVFERSLAERIKQDIQDTKALKEVKGLKRKLQYALDKGWLVKSDFFFVPDISIQRDQELLDFIYNHFIDKRNELSHEPKSLDILWHVPEELALLGRLINKIWRADT